MEYILTLTFMTETGKKNSLTISGVKEDVIISNDIFETKNGAYISKVEAKLTERKITTFDAQ
ncbi:MAG: DUF2922 domain-containing protein [Clostridium sp.]|uniref:DUF2922 domain-containing protein n=1 Tax=Clostridium sp. TaxID=1506 RepID=UPI0029146939|nr:DUF2922 domain-containing protein [Clostridium sp.]MDU7178524.1 DUF2922 domain-containing protein [Clostridium sp.]